MAVSTGFDQHVPEIERRIAEIKPHAIVLGLGPSAYLLPKVDKKLLAGVRLVGVNDVCRIMPVNDIVTMDGPTKALHPEGDRYPHIRNATPDRFWIYQDCWKAWMFQLPETMHSRCKPFALRVMPRMDFTYLRDNPPKLAAQTIDHIIASPTGATMIAWREGCRRIGVIGVDLLPQNHKLANDHDRYIIDWFFWQIAHQSLLLRGRIANLSPFSTLSNFEQASWTPAKAVS